MASTVVRFFVLSVGKVSQLGGVGGGEILATID
jgi:hypothetical protein